MASAWGTSWGTSWGDSWGASGDAPVVAEVAVKTGTGGIDRRRTIFKPTGLVDRPVKKSPTIEERIEDAREIQAEVIEERKAEILVPPIALMTSAEIDAEIGVYLRELQAKAQTEDELFIVLMMAVM